MKKLLMTVTGLGLILAFTVAPAHADGNGVDEMALDGETRYQEVRQPPQHDVGREGRNDTDDTRNDVYRGPREQPPKGVDSEDLPVDEENGGEEEREEDRNEPDEDDEQGRNRNYRETGRPAK